MFYQAESRSKTERRQNEIDIKEEKMENSVISQKKNEMGQHSALEEQVHVGTPSGGFDPHRFV